MASGSLTSRIYCVLLLLKFVNSVIGGVIPGESMPSRKDPLEYFLLEELPANTSIGNAAIDALLTYKYNASVLSRLSYHFVNADPRQHLFAINSSTSIIRTTERIDRDTVCPHEDDCGVWLHIGVLPEEYAETIRIIVDILDINDHQPVFLQPELNIQVSESTEPGASWIIPPATDMDSHKYGVTDYELRAGGGGKFELEVISDELYPESTELKLVLVEQLDREQQESYDLKVVAYDGGEPQRSGSIVVHVIVDDINDNNPKFVNATYEFFIMENVGAGTTLGQVHARDIDSGANAEIFYTLTEESEAEHGDLFGVTNGTGMVYQKQPMDFETRSTYLLTIAAYDRGSSSQPAHCTVIVRVKDANDNHPFITLNTPNENNIVRVSEAASLGTIVAQITVSDQDGGDNGRVECYLDNAYFTIQMAYMSQYRIITTAQLHTQSAPEVAVEVRCHDMGRVPNVATQNLIIQIVASNTHPPVFTQAAYFAIITENNHVNDYIMRVVAEDEDEGMYGDVRYILEHSAAADFRLDTLTGDITANRVFDHERETELRFTVIAYDMGIPSLSGTATVNVQILDMDDSVPRFSQEHYEFGVFENQPVLSDVGTVSLQPMGDVDLTGMFLFSFGEPSNLDSQAFSLSAVTGKITTRTNLDRESQPVYYLSVVARNEGLPPMTGTVSVTIYVADKNDNPPLIQFPNEQNHTVYLSGAAPVGYTITTIRAIDADLGGNGQIKYSIFKGNDHELFDIGVTSGNVILRSDLSGVQDKSHSLTIQVEDHGIPRQVVYARLNIVINETMDFIRVEPSGAVVSQENATAIISVTGGALVLVFLILFSVMMYLVWRRLSPKPRTKKDERCCYSNVSTPYPCSDEYIDRGVAEGEEASTLDNRLNTQRHPPTPPASSNYSTPRDSYTDNVLNKATNVAFIIDSDYQPSPGDQRQYAHSRRSSTSTFKPQRPDPEQLSRTPPPPYDSCCPDMMPEKPCPSPSYSNGSNTNSFAASDDFLIHQNGACGDSQA